MNEANLNQLENQPWDDQEFCDAYENTWDISVDEVHYGWLAPGENQLRLLGDSVGEKLNILDIGCGLGQNLISLAKSGATCFGLDISSSMLQKAEKLNIKHGLENHITLEKGDMRSFSNFEGIKFDVILSVYSMEYLNGIQDLKAVVHSVYKRLKPGGIFIMCYSHPSQVRRYPELMNCSVPIGRGNFRTYNYSYKDGFDALIKSGFTIERVIEQSTNNPSNISYENGKAFPYHFKEGRNPCKSDYDEISNDSPHTVIYKARKHNNPLLGIPTQGSLSLGYRDLWGSKRSITNVSKMKYLGLSFSSIHLAPMDNVLGITDILRFEIHKYDISVNQEPLLIDVGEVTYEVPCNSIFGLLHRKILGSSLEPVYKAYVVESSDGAEKKIILDSIIGVDVEVKNEFRTSKIGILLFVNGEEPCKGEIGIDVIDGNVGDKIELMYISLMENKKGGSADQLQLTF